MVKMIPFFKQADPHPAHKRPKAKIHMLICCVLCGLHMMAATGLAQDKVLLGVATGLTSLKGRESLRAANLAVEQLNAHGGIRVGGRALTVKLVSIDLKDERAPLRVDDVLARLELAQQWKKMQSPAMLCGFISPMMGPGAWKTFEGQIAGALNVIFELGNVPSERYPQAAAFYQAYAARYGSPIQSGHGPAPAYESVHVLAAAIEAAGSLDPEKIITALKSTDRIGVMGRLRFHPGQQAAMTRPKRLWPA